MERHLASAANRIICAQSDGPSSLRRTGPKRTRVPKYFTRAASISSPERDDLLRDLRGVGSNDCMVRVLRHDALHQTNEQCLVLTLKGMKGSAVRLASRLFHPGQEPFTRGSQFADPRAAIIRADRPL